MPGDVRRRVRRRYVGEEVDWSVFVVSIMNRCSGLGCVKVLRLWMERVRLEYDVNFGEQEARDTWGHTVFRVLLFRWLVDDGTVLERAEIEHPNASIGAAGHENIDAVGAEPGSVR